MEPLILASASPRRRELLARCGFAFQTDPATEPENCPAEHTGKKRVLYLAVQKAKEVQRRHREAVILAADTMVAQKDTLLGKPKTPKEAKAMLRLLSGATHQVYTGVAIVSGEKTVSFVTQTDVTFRPLSDAEIDCYVAGGEPMDKAGGYGIQGAGGLFVTKINGDYSNVVGLPLAETAQALFSFHIFPEWMQNKECEEQKK